MTFCPQVEPEPAWRALEPTGKQLAAIENMCRVRKTDRIEVKTRGEASDAIARLKSIPLPARPCRGFRDNGDFDDGSMWYDFSGYGDDW